MAGSKPAALPLGDTPTRSLLNPVVVPPPVTAREHSHGNHRRPTCRSNCRRAVSGDRLRPRVIHPCHSLWLAREHRGRMRRIYHRCENTGAGARESRGPVATEPVERARDGRVSTPDHGFAVVPTAGPQEAGNCDDRRIPCQFRGFEHFSRTDGDVGLQQQVDRLRKVHGHQSLAHALGPGRVAVDENGHVGAETQSKSRPGASVSNPVPHS